MFLSKIDTMWKLAYCLSTGHIFFLVLVMENSYFNNKMCDKYQSMREYQCNSSEEDPFSSQQHNNNLNNYD